MKYSEFFQSVRDDMNDALDNDNPRLLSTVIGRFAWDGLKAIQSMFPETRLDPRGRQAALPAEPFTEATAGSNLLPIPAEFEPALLSYVLARVYNRDSDDTRDKERAKYHQARWLQLTGG